MSIRAIRSKLLLLSAASILLSGTAAYAAVCLLQGLSRLQGRWAAREAAWIINHIGARPALMAMALVLFLLFFYWRIGRLRDEHDADSEASPETGFNWRSRALRRLREGSFWFDLSAAAVAAALLLAALLHWSGDIVSGGAGALEDWAEPSVLLDRQGKLLGELSSAEYSYRDARLQEEEIPELVKAAFVATEDKRFYQHGGVDGIGLLRAAAANAASGRILQGGSSITQQLARTAFLSNERTLSRKAAELSAALALERNYSKDELLRQYLSRVYMGRQLHGIKAAAQAYFGITRLERLQLWQIATLAALPKGPALYDPATHPQQSKQRRILVLQLMHQQGYITGQQLKEAAQPDYQAPATVPARRAADKEMAVYKGAVMQEAMEKASLTRKELLAGGYRIETGLDAEMQKDVQAVFSKSELFPKSSLDKPVQGAAVVLDNRTADIMAVIGGLDASADTWNRAYAKRQPGSAFKPIAVYGPALETGTYNPDSMLLDRKLSYGSYSPSNLSGVYQGSMSMRQAVRNSVNAPAVWLLKQIGVAQSARFAAKLGIKLGKEDRNLSSALGGLSAGVSPVELAQAYHAFAAGGIYEEAHLITSIRDRDGRVVYSWKPAGKRAMSQQTAASMTSMLRDAALQGTARKAGLKPGTAGKTGTTQLDGGPLQASRDAWFAGYNDSFTAVVWLGLDRAGEEHMTASGVDAARIFASLERRFEAGGD